MSGSDPSVRLEFVGGPHDGETHVARLGRFSVGPGEDADVLCRDERLLPGDAKLVFAFDESGALSVSSSVDIEVGGATTQSVGRLAEGSVLRIGATELLVAEVTPPSPGWSEQAGGESNGVSGGLSSADGPEPGGVEELGPGAIVCKNPACGAINEPGSAWCRKCGRNL